MRGCTYQRRSGRGISPCLLIQQRINDAELMESQEELARYWPYHGEFGGKNIVVHRFVKVMGLWLYPVSLPDKQKGN